jgi:hypothetical protein
MVDVTDGADVDVRLVALELLLRHFNCSFGRLGVREGVLPGEPGKAIANRRLTSAGCA